MDVIWADGKRTADLLSRVGRKPAAVSYLGCGIQDPGNHDKYRAVNVTAI